MNSPPKTRTPTSEGVLRALSSPTNPVFSLQRRIELTEIPKDLEDEYSTLSRSHLETIQGDLQLEGRRLGSQRVLIANHLDEIKTELQELTNKEEEAIAFLNSVDDKKAQLARTIDQLHFKVLTVDTTAGETARKQSAVYQLLTYSTKKRYAQQALAETRKELGMETHHEVELLSYRGCFCTIYKLQNLGLEEHSDFTGDGATEDFNGEICTRKGNHVVGVFHDRIIKYLQVPKPFEERDSKADTTKAAGFAKRYEEEDGGDTDDDDDDDDPQAPFGEGGRHQAAQAQEAPPHGCLELPLSESQLKTHHTGALNAPICLCPRKLLFVCIYLSDSDATSATVSTILMRLAR